MLTVMPIAVVPCLVGSCWLPKLFARCSARKDWDDDKHGDGTAVILKSDKRRDEAFLALEAGGLRCVCPCSRDKVAVKQTAD